MVAAQNGNLKVVEELLKRGANPDLAANDFTMALHLAIHSGHLRCSSHISGLWVLKKQNTNSLYMKLKTTIIQFE
jgi:ankyrin repeat protein